MTAEEARLPSNELCAADIQFAMDNQVIGFVTYATVTLRHDYQTVQVTLEFKDTPDRYFYVKFIENHGRLWHLGEIEH